MALLTSRGAASSAMTSCALRFPVAAPTAVAITRRGPVYAPPLDVRGDDVLNPVNLT